MDQRSINTDKGLDARTIRFAPGQLWQWALKECKGFWAWQRVTERARQQIDLYNVDVVHNGDLFTVIAVDDPGPFVLSETTYDICGNCVIVQPITRPWHIVALRGALCWFRQDWSQHAELLADVP